MSEKFELTWEVDDGYCGGGRPQELEIDLDEFARDYDTAEQIESAIEELIQDDFAQNIRWTCDDIGDAVKAVLDYRAKIEDEGDETEVA